MRMVPAHTLRMNHAGTGDAVRTKAKIEDPESGETRTVEGDTSDVTVTSRQHAPTTLPSTRG